MFGTAGDAVVHSLVPHMAGRGIAPGLCAVAFWRVGKGCVGFFGDVNAEPATLQIVTTLARLQCPIWTKRYVVERDGMLKRTPARFRTPTPTDVSD